MEKFFSSLYDFFAFSLPGVCIIASVLLIRIDGEALYCQILGLFSGNWSIISVFMIVAGYIAGYIVRPVARSLLLMKLSVFLDKRVYACFKRKESITGRDYVKLLKDLRSTNLSKDFVRIRELAPNSARYIEFWDMHMTMSHNLAFACIVFIICQIWNLLSKSYCQGAWIWIAAAGLAFFILIKTSLHYGFWWHNDKVEAVRFIDEVELNLKGKHLKGKSN
jgi:hypothetical protein